MNGFNEFCWIDVDVNPGYAGRYLGLVHVFPRPDDRANFTLVRKAQSLVDARKEAIATWNNDLIIVNVANPTRSDP